FVAVGAIEGKFYDQLVKALGLDPRALPSRQNHESWAGLRQLFAERFRTRTRDEWCALMEGSDACFAPVLSMTEAPFHPHIAARQTVVTHDDVVQPAPAPRFSRTPGSIRPPPRHRGDGGTEALRDWGVMQVD
ncbi:MAG: CoA transferase, partial [Reyranella sp.]|uniref:CoA transferase n=1 Tax=Reyranella sp. TaxID=1929291 RepID=UPI003D0FC11D